MGVSGYGSVVLPCNVQIYSMSSKVTPQCVYTTLAACGMVLGWGAAPLNFTAVLHRYTHLKLGVDVQIKCER